MTAVGNCSQSNVRQTFRSPEIQRPQIPAMHLHVLGKTNSTWGIGRVLISLSMADEPIGR